MIKSAMRSALKESLMKMKQGSRNERAKAYVKGESDDTSQNSRNSKGSGPGGSEHMGQLAQGSEKGLRSKVADAEADAMEELESPSPSEYEGSPEEEMTESAAEAREEGDPPEYRSADYWRDEQKSFMKNKSTAKGPQKAASFVVAISGKSGGKKSGKKG